MKMTSKIFNVEITEQEAELLSEFLNNEVVEWRKMYENGGGETTYRMLSHCKELRDGFAELVGKHYMGVDA